MKPYIRLARRYATLQRWGEAEKVLALSGHPNPKDVINDMKLKVAMRAEQWHEVTLLEEHGIYQRKA